METEIKMTEEELKEGLNGFKMKDGSLLVIRTIKVNDRGTSVTGLHITGWTHGIQISIPVEKKVSSYREAVEELTKAGY